MPAGATQRLVFVEIAFTAGKDGRWFSSDDAVHHYFTHAFDPQGRVTSRQWVQPRADASAFTGQDERQDLERFTFDAQGRRAQARTYSAPGPDGKWGTDDDTVRWVEDYEYAADGKLARRVRRAGEATTRLVTYGYDGSGREIMDAEYNAPGPDGRWGTADDALEKYHRFVWNDAGGRARSMEYHVAHRGAGVDGRWFTEDDVVSSTKMHLYDGAGKLVKELKAVGSGTDGVWFTDDDVLQYYTLYRNEQLLSEPSYVR